MLKILKWFVIGIVGLILIGAFLGESKEVKTTAADVGGEKIESTKPDTNLVGDLMAKAGTSQMNSIAVQVATDAEEQYNIAKREGDKIQICVQAMSVSAAYLQAKDEENYRKWKKVQKQDCKKAGMPDM